ncbi:extracellular solute-binding protein [Paenibacillus sp. Soil750]|uniref:extracellular solute-binding protein n=1 Tax=Paenibacillus sp. Soil750 TaxID=1736398 RepID=UPI0006FDF46D|nr:extracellular solute-binding protein [Paenibacillus sp. Soil750]KRE69767.1 hypothetical protein ASL11_15495 [Paenibacillus sp. Soil750]
MTKFKSMFVCPTIAAFLLIFIVACSNSGEEATSLPTNTTNADTNLKPNTDIMAKYDPPITIKTIFEVNVAIKEQYSDLGLKNNLWNKAMKDELGINLVYKWITRSTEQSLQKVSIDIASGDLPDIFNVNIEQLALLSKAELINKDLGPIYDQYASQLTKSIMKQEGNSAFQAAMSDGKLTAIPMTNSSGDAASFMWIRKDWLIQLNLQEPKNLNELHEVIKAFVKADLGKTGKPVGLMLSKDFLQQGVAEAIGIFNGFHAYPQTWINDSSGHLVYGSTLPEMKKALTYLQTLYREGLIEKDFAAKDWQRATDAAAANRSGVEFGAMWNAMTPLQKTKDNFPDSDWRGLGILSSDDQPAKAKINLNNENYIVVKKGFGHPEALIKLLNLFTEKSFGENMDEYNKFYNVRDGVTDPLKNPGLHYMPFRAWPTKKNLQAHENVVNALKTGEVSKLTPEQKGYFENILKYKAGDNSMAQYEKVFGVTGSYNAMKMYYDKNLFMMDRFYGSPTETMKSKMKIISDKEMEYYTKVIMGVESVDNFDVFIQELNKIGLLQITKEVNEWNNNK